MKLKSSDACTCFCRLKPRGSLSVSVSVVHGFKQEFSKTFFLKTRNNKNLVVDLVESIGASVWVRVVSYSPRRLQYYTNC